MLFVVESFDSVSWIGVGSLGKSRNRGCFRGSLFWPTNMCCIWYQYGSSLFYFLIFVRVVLLSFEFLFFAAKEFYSSLVLLLRSSCFSVTKLLRFSNVIERPLPRVGLSFQILLSIS